MTWVQVNIGLARTGQPVLTQAQRVFDSVMPVLDALRLDGRLRRFHFMRKPPDIRLRLEGNDASDDLVGDVEAVLDRLTASGVVVSHTPGIYEPETRLFGGEQAMSFVHDYFDADSRAWVDHDRLERAGATLLTADELTSRVAEDLFARTLGDQAEVWDTWCNVCQVVRKQLDDDSLGAAATTGGLRDGASPGEAELLARYGTANTDLAAGLRTLAQQGALEGGLRTILPFVAVFHFHRYGLDQGRQGALALSMARAWDPRRGMR